MRRPIRSLAPAASGSDVESREVAVRSANPWSCGVRDRRRILTGVVLVLWLSWMIFSIVHFGLQEGAPAWIFMGAGLLGGLLLIRPWMRRQPRRPPDLDAKPVRFHI